MNNTALAKWRARQASPGGWVSLGELHIVEVMSRMPFDWLCFDLQHGLLSEKDLLQMLAVAKATSVTPIVRVASNDAGRIGRALDAGAEGVIVPMVETAEEAAALVSACRYPPDGARSCGPMRDFLHSGPQYLAEANDQIAAIAMIETQKGLDNVSAIAGTPGIDALFVGPMDLCFGLGIRPGAFDDPVFVEALACIEKAGREAGCAVGMYGYDVERARDALASGYVFASIGTDIGFLRMGAQSAFSELKVKTGGSDAAPPSY